MIVEPPTTFGAARGGGVARPLGFRARLTPAVGLFGDRLGTFWLRSQAFSSASHSTPLCSAKPASSEAMTARFRFGEMRA